MNVFQRIRWAVALLPILVACETYEMPPIIPQKGSDVSFSGGNSITLQKDDADKTELEFTVTAADFGAEGKIRYELQMDLPNANFDAPVKLGESESNFIKVNVAEFNKALLAKNLPFGVASDVAFRVKSTFDQPMNPIFGSTLTLKVTPYDATVAFPVMYVPGDYQGWNPANDKTVLYSENFDNKFKGFVHILGGSREFKFTEGPNWDNNYGDTGGDLKLDKDGENIKVAEDGTYEINVDLIARTYSIGEVKRWGIVGSATAGDWSTDTPMDVFDRTTNSLKITVDLKEGEFKFRANNNWDYNFGGNNGELSANGPNIGVAAAGNYTITLTFGSAGKVNYSLVKN